VLVGLIELDQGIADPVPIIEDAVPLQAADDLEAQGLDTAAEGGGSKPGVHQEIAGRKALSQGCLDHLQGQGRFAQLLSILQTSGQISPGLAGLGLSGLRRGGLGAMVAEIHGIEIFGGQQSQGQDLIAFDGFALGVVIDETQIFQALAPFGEGGGIQDEAVVLGSFGPLQPPAQLDKETPEQRLNRSVQQVVDRLEMQKHQIGKDKQEVPGAETFMLADTGSGQIALDMQRGKQFLDPQFQVGAEIFQGRFDLSLKENDFPVMQEKAPFMWVSLMICNINSTNLEPFPLY